MGKNDRSKPKASTSRKKNSSGIDYSIFLVGAFLLALIAATAWYLSPAQNYHPTVMTEREVRHKAQALAHQSPHAEVFDLAPLVEKKK